MKPPRDDVPRAKPLSASRDHLRRDAVPLPAAGSAGTRTPSATCAGCGAEVPGAVVSVGHGVVVCLACWNQTLSTVDPGRERAFAKRVRTILRLDGLPAVDIEEEKDRADVVEGLVGLVLEARRQALAGSYVVLCRRCRGRANALHVPEECARCHEGMSVAELEDATVLHGRCTTVVEKLALAAGDFAAAGDLEAAPIPIRIHCPICRELHVDEGEFADKPHTTHACQACGHVWKPAKVPTVGVRFLPGYKNEERSETR